jgi:putative copper export protein
MDILIHWLHLMAAIIWVGGTFAISLAVQPALRRFLKDSSRFDIYREIGARFKIVMWVCWLTLLGTGLLKLWEIRDTPSIFFGPWGRILAIKLCLVACMVVLTLLHTYSWGPRLMETTGTDATASRVLIVKMAFWGKVNLVILAGIIFCATALRFSI